MSALAKSGSEAAQWPGYQWPGTPIKCVMVEVLGQKNFKSKSQKINGVKNAKILTCLNTFLTVKKNLVYNRKSI